MRRLLSLLFAAPIALAFASSGCAAEQDDDEGYVVGDDPGEVAVDESGAALCAGYDATMGARLARQAKRRMGYRSQHLCYHYVKRHLEAVGIPIRNYLDADEEGSAYMFTSWARSEPSELRAIGFAEMPRTRIDMNNLPIGSIIVWGRGECGYNAQHGHIEVVVSRDMACSDFCGHIKRGCGLPDVFVPVRSGNTCQ
jgi:hypothetical protein